MTRRRCPVCWRLIGSTQWKRVALHRDSINRDICPMSSEPFDLMEHEPLMEVSA